MHKSSAVKAFLRNCRAACCAAALAAGLSSAAWGAAAAAVAAKPNPPQARFQAAFQRFQTARSLPARAAALDRMEKIRPWLADPARVEADWQRLAAMPNLPPLLVAELENQIGREQQRLGLTAAAAATWNRLGMLRNWLMTGPFDNATPDAIAHIEGPEHGITPTAHYAGKSGSVGWRHMEWPASVGRMRLWRFFSPSQAVSAYLATWVYSRRAQPVALRLSDSGSTRLWVNGQLLFTEAVIHPGNGFDMHTIPARLAAGWNEILVKDGVLESQIWTFALRATTPAGAVLHLATSSAPHTTPNWAAKPAPKFAVADLTAIARAAATSAAGWQHYAWVLWQKANFNQGSQNLARAFEQAETLAEKEAATGTAAAGTATGTPTTSNVAAGNTTAGNTTAEQSQNQNQAPTQEQAQAQSRLRRIELDFAETDSNQGRAYRNLRRLLASGAGAGAAEALARRGEIKLSRKEFWPARQDFEAALRARLGAAGNANAQNAAMLEAPHAELGLFETYAGMGLKAQALALARRLRLAGGASMNGLGLPISELLPRLGLHAEALAWAEAAWRDNHKNPALYHRLAFEQLHNGDPLAATRTLAAVLAQDPTSRVQAMQAEILAGLGNYAAAREALNTELRLHPDGHHLWRRLGDLEYNAGLPAAAARAWQAAMQLDPQDSRLARRLRLLEGVKQQASFYQPYRVAAAKMVGAMRRRPPAQLLAGPLGIVANTTVVRIFPSGNVGRYVQQIFRINNRVGAEALASYAVTYDPRRQAVHFLAARVYHADGSTADAAAPGDTLISQSVGYQTYYNVRNKYVVLPALRPGDYVQIAYRILPTTLESLYGNYFGELQPFQTAAPELEQQLVVLTPENLPLYYDAVRFPGQARVAHGNGLKIYRWQLRNEPAMNGEPNGPPAIAQIPYVIVSAFRSWPQFARWYQGLIRDTFVMDGALKRTTDRLVRGLHTDEQKVKAIYNYVIRNTHYVALEFGIHGYRPYPVSEIFRRRFGDCKDKASLLIAMLARAGIDSNIVLVRTRELGPVATKIPAVGDFDHAIVYVPELGWYLDGTAEYNGARELPAADQHALVFRIPVGSDLRADGLDPKPNARQNTARQPGMALQPVFTPVLPAASNSVVRTITGRLSASGRFRFREQATVLGQNAPYYRHGMQIAGRRAGVLQAMLRGALPGVTVSQARAINANHYNRPLTMVFHAQAPRFAAPEPGGALRLPRQLEPTVWLPRMAPLASRRTPVHLGSPQLMVETLAIQLPAGYTLTPPAALHLKAPFARFDYTAQWQNGVLKLALRLETLQTVVPVAEYPAFRRFWLRVDGKLDAGIQAEKQAAALHRQAGAPHKQDKQTASRQKPGARQSPGARQRTGWK